MTYIPIIVALTIYKLGSLATGSLFALLGYRLFKAGIWGKAGDLTAQYKDNKFILKSAAPGTFFAVLGAAVVGATIWQGLQMNQHTGPEMPAKVASDLPPPLPDSSGGQK